jgi:hypothetical protein
MTDRTSRASRASAAARPSGTSGSPPVLVDLYGEAVEKALSIERPAQVVRLAVVVWHRGDPPLAVPRRPPEVRHHRRRQRRGSSVAASPTTSPGDRVATQSRSPDFPSMQGAL